MESACRYRTGRHKGHTSYLILLTRLFPCKPTVAVMTEGPKPIVGFRSTLWRNQYKKHLGDYCSISLKSSVQSWQLA